MVRKQVLRGLSALMAALVIVGGLTQLPASAAPANDLPLAERIQPLARVTGVTSQVTPTTPVFQIDVTFTLTGVDCTDGAELHYNISGTGDKTTICTPGQTPVPTSVRVRRPVFDGPDTDVVDLVPGGNVLAKGLVYTTGAGTDKTAATLDVYTFRAPPKPIWVGIGDGYTSQVIQWEDGVTEGDCSDPGATFPVPEPCLDLDNEHRSWIQTSVESVNGQFAVPEPWEIEPYVVATSTGAASAMSSQIGLARAKLLERKGSWNWVGFSAGFVDAGVPSILSQWYADNDPQDPASPLPWDIQGSSTQCPVVQPARDTIRTWFPTGTAGNLSNPNSVRSALKSMVDSLVHPTLGDPNARVIQLLYPYMTEVETQVFGPFAYDNPCGLRNMNLVNDLNQAVEVDTTTTPNLFTLDLRGPFSNFPNGVLTYDDPDPAVEGDEEVYRNDPQIQLSRPHGWPYPTTSGAGTVGGAVIDLVFSEGSDETPPIVVGSPTRVQPDFNDWYNHEVGIEWDAYDPEPGSGLLEPERWPYTEPITTETADFLESIVAWDNQENWSTGTLYLQTDYTAPQITGGPVAEPNAKGWFNEAVDVVWSFTNDDGLSGNDSATEYRATFGEDGIQTVANPNPASGKRSDGDGLVKGQTATMCDLAGNCATHAVDLHIDTTAPTVGSTLPPSASGWYKGAVTITWQPADGLSGLAEDNPSNELLVTGDGVQDIAMTFCDNADNCTEGVAQVKFDNAPPVVNLPNLPADDTYYTADLGGAQPPAPTCDAIDGESGLASCTISEPTVADIGGGVTRYEHTLVAVDNVGNQTTETIVYFLSDNTPPALTVDTVQQSNGAGWFKSVVDIVWTAVDDDGSLVGEFAASSTLQHPSDHEGNKTYAKTAENAAGLTATASISPKIDLTAPEAHVEVNGAPVEDWYTDAVTVSWWFDGDPLGPEADEASGVDGGTKATDTTVSSSGSVTNGAGTMCDLAGNCTAVGVDINIDPLAPIVGAELAGEQTEGSQWFRGDVTVTWSAEDPEGGSGLAGDLPEPMVVTDDGVHEVNSAGVDDVAGNTGYGTATVRIDGQAPTLELTGLDERDEYPFDEAPEVGCTAADQVGLSGLTADCELVTETTRTEIDGNLYDVVTVTATASDHAGNVTTIDRTYRVGPLDTAPPVVTGTPRRDADGNQVGVAEGSFGWFNKNIAIAWTAFDADPSAGLPASAQNLADTLVTAEGKNQVIAGPIVTDNSGKESAPTSVTVSVDKTAPVPTLTGIVAGKAYTLDDPALQPVCQATDGLSGVDTCLVDETTTPLPPYAPPGWFVTAKAVATDNAGNQGTSASVTYVLFDFDRFGGDACEGDEFASSGFSASTYGGGHGSDGKDRKWGSKYRWHWGWGHGGSHDDGSGEGNGDECTPCASSDSASTSSYSASTWGWGHGGHGNGGHDDDDDDDDCNPCLSTSSSAAGYTASTNGHGGHGSGGHDDDDDDDCSTGGRMTGGGAVGNVSASFTLRCNGSPNQLTVTWPGNKFELTTVNDILCWDGDGYDEAQPRAPHDSLWLAGTGKLNGRSATIDITLTDRGEPGKNTDTMWLTIKEGATVKLGPSGGKLTDNGNIQAHEAQGNGTNDNGNVNGPNGRDKDGYDRDGYDRDGYNRSGFDKDGYNKSGFDKDGYNKSGVDKDGYNKSGFDKDGYNRSGFDKYGYNKSGFDKYGYNKYGYDKYGYDEDGADRDGKDKRGKKIKSPNKSYDKHGYDRDGFDRDGWDKKSCNRAGYDKSGKKVR